MQERKYGLFWVKRGRGVLHVSEFAKFSLAYHTENVTRYMNLMQNIITDNERLKHNHLKPSPSNDIIIDKKT